MQVSTSTDGIISFEPKIPGELLPFQIHGSEPGYNQGRYGEIFFQKVVEKRYTFFHSIYKMTEDTTIHTHHDESWLGFRLVLKDHINHIVNGSHAVRLKQGQFSFGYSPVTDSSFDLYKNRTYTTFDMRLDRSILQDAVQQDKTLRKFVDSIEQSQSVSLPNARWSDIATQEAVEQLFKYPRNEALAIILIRSLLNAAVSNSHNIPITEDQIEALYRVKACIKENMLNHTTIPELARQTGINSNLLKSGFLQVFKKSPYQYLLHERLKLAKILLMETNHRIQEIASDTGFQHDTSLIRAFKKEFNETPHAWRKTNRHRLPTDFYPE